MYGRPPDVSGAASVAAVAGATAAIYWRDGPTSGAILATMLRSAEAAARREAANRRVPSRRCVDIAAR